MTILGRRGTEVEQTIAVPRLIDDPEFARASELLAAFSDYRYRLQRLKRRIELEAHFRSRATTSDQANDAALRAQLASLSSDPPLTAAPVVPATTDKPSSAIARGIQLLAGAAIPVAQNDASRLAEIERRDDAVAEAINEQTVVVDSIADALTLTYAKQLKPAWDALQLEMFEDFRRASRTVQRVQELRQRITAAGIRSRSDLLQTPNVRAPLFLGVESDWNSEISGWRRILEKLGMLK